MQYILRKTKKLSLICPYFAKKRITFACVYFNFLRVPSILINVHFVQGCLDPQYCKVNFRPRLEISHEVQSKTVRCFDLRVCF